MCTHRQNTNMVSGGEVEERYPRCARSRSVVGPGACRVAIPAAESAASRTNIMVNSNTHGQKSVEPGEGGASRNAKTKSPAEDPGTPVETTRGCAASEPSIAARYRQHQQHKQWESRQKNRRWRFGCVRRCRALEQEQKNSPRTFQEHSPGDKERTTQSVGY